MTRMADEDDIPALRDVTAALGMDFRNQRACRIDHRQRPLARQILDPLGHAMGAEHRHGPGRDVLDFLDEDCAATAEISDDMPIVDDLVPDIDWWPELDQRTFDDFDRPLDAGAEATWLGQHNLNHPTPHNPKNISHRDGCRCTVLLDAGRLWPLGNIHGC